jgi:chromatin remodeling complex protein RSC6
MPSTNSQNVPKKAKKVNKVKTVVTAVPKVETVKVEKPPKVEKAKAKAPKVEKAKAPKVEKAKAPKVEKVKAPKVEKVKAPKVEKVKAPKVEKVKAPKVEKVKAPKVEKVKAPKVEVPDPVAPEQVPEVSDTPYMEEFTSALSDMDAALTMIRALKARLQKLEKQVHRDHKANLKKIKGKKRRIPNPNAEPSGFQKPGPVSPELAKFLSLAKDELISRTDVTRRINTYCKGNNLQNPEDKRKILPDAPLLKLLKMNKTDKLTFFNLQKYMKVHYPNKEGVYPTA